MAFDEGKIYILKYEHDLSMRDYGIFGSVEGKSIGCPPTFYDCTIEHDYQIHDIEEVHLMGFTEVEAIEKFEKPPVYIVIMFDKLKRSD